MQVLCRQALLQRCARLERERRVRKGAGQAHEKPMSVDRGVPVVTAVERRREFAGRADIGITVHRMRDLIGILLVHAVEREVREAGSGFDIKTAL